jgi:hypothetical protein
MPVPFRSESHSSITVGGVQEVVSALDPLVLTQDTAQGLTNVERVDGARDLRVYADVVIIRGPLVLPGRKVEIFARTVGALEDSKKQWAAIDVSGRPGGSVDLAGGPVAKKGKTGKRSAAKAGEPGEKGFVNLPGKPGGDGATGEAGQAGSAGAAGQNAGSIYIRCEQLLTEQDFGLFAVGGRGQDGQEGQDGQDGQDGGPGLPGNKDPFNMQLGTRGGKGGNGGKGGSGGAGGHGGNGGYIELAMMMPHAGGGHLDPRPMSGDMGNPGKSGRGGTRGSGGQSGIAFTQDRVPYQMTKGADGDSDGATPVQTVNPRNEAAYGDWQNPEPDYGTIDVSPAQCAMMMQRIRWAYLAGDSSVLVLLQWMQAVTAGRQPAIHSQCHALARQLCLGLSYHGYRKNYSPRTSPAFYKSHLETLCANLTALEKESLAYYKTRGDNQQTVEQLRIAGNKAGQQIAALAESKKQVETQLTGLAGAISGAHSAVLKQEGVLTEAVQRMQVQIHNVEGLSLGDFIKVVTSVTPPSGAADVKGMVKAVATVGSGLKDIWDKEKKAEYKISRLGVLGENVKSLGDAFRDSGGVIKSSDPNAYKLIASGKDLEEALKKYDGTLAFDEVRAALRSLIELSQLRNRLIVDYNGLVGRSADLGAQITQAVELQQQVNEGLQKASRPDLPAFSAFVDDLFQKSKNEVIHQLYLASRAYAFWALEDYPLFENLLGLKVPSTVTATVLDTARVQILSAFARTVENRGAIPQQFPSAAERKKDPAAPGVVVSIDGKNFPRAFRQLVQNKEMVVRLPPVLPHANLVPLIPADEAGSMSGFNLMGEVTITRLRVFLRGGTAAKQQIKVTILHNGTHEFVRRDGNIVLLTSSPIRILFKYQELGSDGRQQSIDLDGDFTQDDLIAQTGRYSAISPFATWRIQIDAIENPHVKWNEVKALDLEFHGGGYSFV